LLHKSVFLYLLTYLLNIDTDIDIAILVDIVPISYQNRKKWYRSITSIKHWCLHISASV